MTFTASFICGGALVPASRYRVHPVKRALDDEQWETSLLHGYGEWDHRISHPSLRRGYRLSCRLLRAARTALLTGSGPVLVQRLALPWWSAPENRLAGRRPLVFDFDDAVFLGATGKPHAARRKALTEVCKNASHVIAGNAWLAERITTEAPISIIPTCLDTSRYVPGETQRTDERVRIGWIGTSQNFPYLVQLIEALEELRRLQIPIDFMICSDERNPSLFNRLQAEFVKWSPEGELPFLQSLDIGVMPLADEDWCRGKCSFKMIQYMSVGCPVVASAVGMNNDVLKGETGGRLVVGDQWLDPLMELATSRSTRLALGAAARARAIQDYDVQTAVNANRKILQALQ